VAPFVRLLRLASTVICLIVIASFLIFALDQTNTASTRQQERLAAGSPTPVQTSHAAKPHKQNALKRDIDEVATELTSPFSGLVAGASGEWGDRATKLLLALLIYGFGLGYLARALRVRV
jgi:hypothetical protein